MIEVRRAGAKGLGVFATRRITRGSRLLAEPPLLTITSAHRDVLKAASSLSNDKLAMLLQLSTNDTPRAQRTSLALSLWPTLSSLLSRARDAQTSLHQNRRILNIFYNNNFALGDASGTRALFPTVARLNHACVPSAQGNFNTALRAFTIHALRDIPADEEVTISYLHDEMALHGARQATLQDGYGFACACPVCIGETRAGSAVRRAAHRILLERYHSTAARNGQQPQQLLLLDMARQLIHNYEAEGLVGGRETASLYSLAASHAVSVDDKVLAEQLGRRALELERDAVGEDSQFFDAARLALERMDFTTHGKPGEVAEKESEELSYAPWT
ncbi:hypothetical protein Micbo1qcDRAFT_31731 [Microdochium bolleyi]|uniref:SET domain-containing protein n=1 Tax=Microdochium bolleyi TaxID=196109 RepID=A0A136JGH4_9PEZI|nr:hypothetical protein Micbo1qcDRAFT_31731 [Microdochium bolleyi]